ncbi:type II toxin-antitoxin system RelE/ParE family toxin [Xanthomonas arboricola]|uniref:Plasmid stabilization protein n=1 Tax=Xanthomonas arboricola pv. guizotiae TaxID=487867 RepID=A0A2S7A2V0_9XANT|nr:hypothetical protein XarbCFBP7409_09775 [Xanthomonas arboricola pv. guizotiae]PPU23177.1 hypothetical protein XarbCFBP7408_12105 [Xanthomonas arboricola pv. guizotiae]
MRVLFRPQARAEALEAQAWSASCAAGLGLEFARALDASVAAAVRSPETFAAVAGSCRRVLLRRFPFLMVYRANGDEFLVLAVFHHRRDPSTLVRRVGG